MPNVNDSQWLAVSNDLVGSPNIPINDSQLLQMVNYITSGGLAQPPEDSQLLAVAINLSNYINDGSLVATGIISGIYSTSSSDYIPPLSDVNANMNTLVATGQTIDCSLLTSFINFINLQLINCNLVNFSGVPTFQPYSSIVLSLNGCNLPSPDTTNGINSALISLGNQYGLQFITPVDLQGNKWPQGSAGDIATGYGALTNASYEGVSVLLTPNDLSVLGQAVDATTIYTDSGINALTYDSAFMFNTMPVGNALTVNDVSALQAALTAAHAIGTISYLDTFSLDPTLGWDWVMGGTQQSWVLWADTPGAPMPDGPVALCLTVSGWYTGVFDGDVRASFVPGNNVGYEVGGVYVFDSRGSVVDTAVFEAGQTTVTVINQPIFGVGSAYSSYSAPPSSVPPDHTFEIEFVAAS